MKFRKTPIDFASIEVGKTYYVNYIYRNYSPDNRYRGKVKVLRFIYPKGYTGLNHEDAQHNWFSCEKVSQGLLNNITIRDKAFLHLISE